MNTVDADVLKALAELANKYGQKLNVSVEMNSSLKLSTTIWIGNHAYTSTTLDNSTFVTAYGKLTRGLALEQETSEETST